MLALGFLTRLPVPARADAGEASWAAAVPWFPLAGACIGGLLALVASLPVHPWLAALLAVLCWVGVTGGLHLDGVADLADALGASHGDPTQFRAVLDDPHLGSFGAMALACVLAIKVVAGGVLISGAADAWAWVWIPAWARWSALAWGGTLDAIGPGAGMRLAEASGGAATGWQGVALFLAGWLAVSPGLALLALAATWGWRGFLRWRVGGMNGDALGAGIEYVECALLLAAAGMTP